MHSVEVRAEDIETELAETICRLKQEYGSNLKGLVGIAISPNAYKSYEYYLMEKCRAGASLPLNTRRDDMQFMGVNILCSGVPYTIPIWNGDGWYCAVEEARKHLNMDKLN